MGEQERRSWRSLRRTKWIAGQLVITLAVLAAVLWAPLGRAGSVGASSKTAAQPPPTPAGMAGAESTILSPAPTGFRDQLQGYYSSLITAAQRTPNQPGTQTLVSYTKVAQQLVSSANDKDLSTIYYETSQLPSFKTVLKKYTMGSGFYAAGQRYLNQQAQLAKLQDKSKIRPLDFASETSCPAAGDTPAVQAGLAIAWVVAYATFQLFSASFFIEFLGEGTTIPVSPIRIIAAVISIPLELAKEGAADANLVRQDCIEKAHRDQMNGMNDYVHNFAAISQVDIHVTPVDSYHFLISTHEFGNPIAINANTIQVQDFAGSATTGQTVLNLIQGTTKMAGVVWAPVAASPDPGLYELTVPTSLAGTSYRISVDDGGARCNNFTPVATNCTHFGSLVFTKYTNS